MRPWGNFNVEWQKLVWAQQTLIDKKIITVWCAVTSAVLRVVSTKDHETMGSVLNS